MRNTTELLYNTKRTLEMLSQYGLRPDTVESGLPFVNSVISQYERKNRITKKQEQSVRRFLTNAEHALKKGLKMTTQKTRRPTIRLDASERVMLHKAIKNAMDETKSTSGAFIYSYLKDNGFVLPSGKVLKNTHVYGLMAKKSITDENLIPTTTPRTSSNGETSNPLESIKQLLEMNMDERVKTQAIRAVLSAYGT